MSNAKNPLAEIFSFFKGISKKQGTGQLKLTANQNQWEFFFFQGRMVYAVTPEHRVRRWLRSLKQQNCYDLLKESYGETENYSPWEYSFLLHALQHQKMSLQKARGVLENTAREVIFSLCQHRNISGKWSPGWELKAYASADLGLTLTEMKGIFAGVHNLGKQWQSLGLDLMYCDRAPSLNITESLPTEKSNSLLNLKPLLNGKRTFWDLVVQMKQPPEAVTRLIHYYIKQGVLEFQTVGDISLPKPQPSPSQPQPQSLKPRPLVACVDDSKQMCHHLEQMLTQAGYRCLCLQDSVKALPQLVQEKPDFILLDLVMPVVNGYELCTHLRRIPAFKNTPIALMTGNSNMMDKVRAKLAKADELLAKPVKGETLLPLLKQSLAQKPAKKSPSLPTPAQPQLSMAS
ncbi:response regulator [Spirulina sp. CS-785/01]|uniref:response regulator n=1 Tax=Spirulina sp. CS-785/01 TaxID=3021716 RepID=UPI00232DE665|nr:response regulator [Spirulina sp. CS-785/01]MDB9315972.1 response regulator [Spirulina sp. CS-785/01]